MGKYDFSDLYKNATMLDQNFLRNEFGYDVGSEYDEIIYKNYYVNICSAIYNNNAYRPSTNEIEEFLENGIIKRCCQCKSNIITSQERKYLFLLAQAKQLKYDRDNGRGSMIRGENQEFTLCNDTYDLLARIGLIKLIRY